MIYNRPMHVLVQFNNSVKMFASIIDANVNTVTEKSNSYIISTSPERL